MCTEPTSHSATWKWVVIAADCNRHSLHQACWSSLSKSADSKFLSTLLFYCFTSYFFTVEKFLIQGLSLSLQEQKFLDSIQKLILMFLICHMFRSKVILASWSNSALKTSRGHLGSTLAQSGCLMSVLSVNPVSFIQDSQLCGTTGLLFSMFGGGVFSHF